MVAAAGVAVPVGVGAGVEDGVDEDPVVGVGDDGTVPVSNGAGVTTIGAGDPRMIFPIGP